jgi:hypothetical protein
MATSYDVVFDRFIKKLRGDLSFFNYTNLSEEQINEIVGSHLNSLLNRSIDKLYEFGLPDFDFYDKDDDLQQFNGDLVRQELSLLSELMFFHYCEEDINKLKPLGMFFRTSEIEVFSPATERKSYMELLKTIESTVVNSISNYFSRNRLTWALKSIYGVMNHD